MNSKQVVIEPFLLDEILWISFFIAVLLLRHVKAMRQMFLIDICFSQWNILERKIH